MTLVRTAASYGAHCASRVRVVGFLREGERVVGAKVRDLEAGTEWQVRARQIVNATGVWTDETQALVGERGQYHVRASKGVHLVVPRDRIHSSAGIITKTERSVLFVIPWGRHWIVGTTDTEWDLDKAHPAASSSDIDYLLTQANKWLTTPLTRADVQGVYAGLRPLLAGESEETSRLSREHVVAHAVPGLVVVAGGKYTTYRLMARDAVDAAVHGLDERVPPSCTEQTPLLGAAGYKAAWNSRERTAAATGLHVARIEHLLRRHGTAVAEVLALAEDDPSLRLPLTGAEDYLRAEVVHAAAYEGRAAPRRRPHEADQDLRRDVRPGARRGRGSRRPHGRGAGVERRATRAGNRALPGAGGGRARVARTAGRPDGGRRAHGSAGHRACPLGGAVGPFGAARGRRPALLRRGGALGASAPRATRLPADRDFAPSAPSAPGGQQRVL